MFTGDFTQTNRTMKENLSEKGYSKPLQNSKRTYFFDIKKTTQGEQYLEISENYSNDIEDHKIIILKRDLLDFQKTLNTICQKAFPKTVKSYSVADMRKTYSNAYKKWSKSEEDYLMLLEADGLSIQEISIRMERQYGSIRSRLLKLNLL